MEASRGRGKGGWAAVSRKPSAAAGPKSAYDDVFGGPPRFAGAETFAAARPGSYAEILGGVVASCTIPFLDLPPAEDGVGEPPAGSKRPGVDYSEVFGGVDFWEFAATYEELLAESKREDGVGSSKGRAPKESNSWQQSTEAFELQLEHPNGNHVPCPDNDQFSSNSNHSDADSKHSNSSYNKSPKKSNLRQQAIEAFELPLETPIGNHVPCAEDDKVSSNSNGSDDNAKHINPSDNKLSTAFKDCAISGITHITEPHAVSGLYCTMLESKFLDTEKGGNRRSLLHEEINDENLLDNHTYSSDGSSISRHVTTEWKQSRQYPFPENDHASMKHQSRPSSSHSVSSGNASSSDITYVSISEINLQTQPSVVPPPSRPPPKIFNKQVRPMVKMHTKSDLLEGGLCKPISNQEKLSIGLISERHMDQEVVKESSPFSFDVEVDVSSAVAASAIPMKEAMELAQARLQSSKEMLERKHDNFHSCKMMDHNANVKHKERVADQASVGTENLGPILIKKAMVNELKQSGMNPREEGTGKNSVDTSPNSNRIGHVVLPVEHEEMMEQNDLKSTKLDSRREKEYEKWITNNNRVEKESEKWKVNEEYYELTSNEKKLSKVSESPEQETFRNKIKQMLKSSEENKRENLEAAEVLEFQSNFQWNNANDGNQKEENAESMRNDAMNFVEKRVGVTSEQEAFRNKVKQTLKVSEENKRENIESAEVLEFKNNTPWNNGKEGNQKEENFESTRNDNINLVEKKVGVTTEQEVSRNKIKQTLKLNEENKRENLEAAEVLEFENNTQWKNANEWSQKEENAKSMRNDAINFVKKRVGVTSYMVPEALMHENVINLHESSACYGERNKMLEEVQGVPGGVNVPHAGECDPAFLEKAGLSNDLNHGRIPMEGKSQDAKEIFESWEASYEFKAIHNTEVHDLKSETTRGEDIVGDVTHRPFEVEETLDPTPRTPALDEKEIKVLDECVELKGVMGKEAAYACNGSEKAVREEQAKSGQAENEILKEENDVALEQEDNKNMKQEHCMMAENDCRFQIDQEQDYLAEVYKKLKAAQEAAMNEEQEKPVKATKNTWQEEDNAKGAQVECQQNDKMQQDYLEEVYNKLKAAQEAAMNEEQEKSVKATINTSQEENNAKGAQVECQQKNTQQSTQVPQTLGNSKESSVHPNSNKVTEDNDTKDDHLKADVGRSSSLNTPQDVFPSPPSTDFNVLQANLSGRRSNTVDSTQDVIERPHMASEKCIQMNKVEDNEMLQTEKDQVDEQAKQLEEKEREREREKDRIAVERATREVHERALADARERAQRIAVERVTADARQRAREKAEFEKATKEARLRAERAAVERATAEARERAAEKARAERAASDAKDRAERSNNASKDRNGSHITQFQRTDSSFQGYSGEGESSLRCKARLERHQRTAERAAKALAEKNRRDILAQREQAERDRLAEYLNAEVKRWSTGKEGNLRALLSTLQYILGTETGWQPIPLQEIVTAAAVKKAYRKATLFVHPDKLQQRGASIQQKYTCEKVFDLLKEAWNRFNSEER